ncbi:MAG: transaldolase family protein [Methylocystis sp.]|uniref:transaldolase family protein n=1 Tax=Methylocystis sp. TaxID=1911079 RepID=UPI003DA3368F
MIFVDSTDEAELSHGLSVPFVKGFTTNPTLFLRALGGECLSLPVYVSAARKLVEFASSNTAARDVMIQGVGAPEQIVAQALTYSNALRDGRGKNLWIKLAPTTEHLALCPALASLRCKTMVTAVFTPLQVCAALESGADGVAIYLGRLMKSDESWERKMETIARLILPHEKMLLRASLSDVAKAEIALRYSEDMTVPFAVAEQLTSSAFSSEAMASFNAQVKSDAGAA